MAGGSPTQPGSFIYRSKVLPSCLTLVVRVQGGTVDDINPALPIIRNVP